MASYLKYDRFIDYVIAHPEVEWDWSKISANPSISWNDVMKHPNLYWDIGGLSVNPNITIDIIIKNIDWKDYKSDSWKLENFTYFNKSITLNDVKKYPLLNRHVGLLSRRSCITLDFVLKNSGINWNWCDLTSNSSISVDDMFIHTHHNDGKPCKWSIYDRAPYNSTFTLQHIIDHPDIKWHWGNILENIDLQYINHPLIKPHIRSNTLQLSKNKTMTLKLIRDSELTYYLSSDVDENQWYKNISKHAKLSLDEVFDYTRRRWNMEDLFNNPNISFKALKEKWRDFYKIDCKHDNNLGDYEKMLFCKPDITLKFINSYIPGDSTLGTYISRFNFDKDIEIIHHRFINIGLAFSGIWEHTGERLPAYVVLWIIDQTDIYAEKIPIKERVKILESMQKIVGTKPYINIIF